VLHGTLFGPAGPGYVQRVALDQKVVLTWPNGADFDPATLTSGKRAEPSRGLGGLALSIGANSAVLSFTRRKLTLRRRQRAGLRTGIYPS
jgi:hypothetical protein